MYRNSNEGCITGFNEGCISGKTKDVWSNNGCIAGSNEEGIMTGLMTGV